MSAPITTLQPFTVALFTRAWIEMLTTAENVAGYVKSPSLRGRGLKYFFTSLFILYRQVALFTRAWIEIKIVFSAYCLSLRRPLYEGVD